MRVLLNDAPETGHMRIINTVVVTCYLTHTPIMRDTHSPLTSVTNTAHHQPYNL